MQVTETSAEGLNREFRVVVPAGELEDKVATRLDELGRTIRLPGFRPGKVPMQILRRRYGATVLREVLESTVQGSSADTISEHNLRPALPPKVDIVSFSEGADLEYKMLVEILPEIPDPNFADLGIERLVVEVPPESVEAAIERIAEQQRKSTPVERPAANGRHPRRRCRGAGRRPGNPGRQPAKTARSTLGTRRLHPRLRGAADRRRGGRAPHRPRRPSPRIMRPPIWPARRRNSRSM